MARIVGAGVFWPRWAEVVEEHPAAVRVGVEEDGVSADGTLGVGDHVAAADGARQTGLQELNASRSLRPSTIRARSAPDERPP